MKNETRPDDTGDETIYEDLALGVRYRFLRKITLPNQALTQPERTPAKNPNSARLAVGGLALAGASFGIGVATANKLWPRR